MIKILWIQPLFDSKLDNEAGRGTHYPLAAFMLEAYSRDVVQSQWSILDFHHLKIDDNANTNTREVLNITNIFLNPLNIISLSKFFNIFQLNIPNDDTLIF
jgi:hypothetical protein